MSSKNIGQGRILKVCDLCGGVDDHPRDVLTAGGPGAPVIAAPTEDMVNKVLDAAPSEDRGRLLRDLMDTSSSEHHYDCGAQAGCPTCTVVARGAKGTGSAMLDHVMSLDDFGGDPGIVKAEAL